MKLYELLKEVINIDEISFKKYKFLKNPQNEQKVLQAFESKYKGKVIKQPGKNSTIWINKNGYFSLNMVPQGESKAFNISLSLDDEFPSKIEIPGVATLYHNYAPGSRTSTNYLGTK